MFYENASALIRRVYERRIHAPAILDAPREFPHATLFAGAWQNIRDEAMQVRLDRAPRFHELMPEQADISANDGQDWRMFILKAYDVDVPENLARMPVLASILADCPEVKSCAVSFLAPHKHIPRHRGPFRGIMRFHLGLMIPLGPNGRPATVMLIDDHEYRIADGDTLLWDDTYPHEVINASDEPRVALLLDVWRPHMPLDMELLSRLIVRGVQIGMKHRGVSYTA